MFGYVTVNQDELKIREYRRYRSFYCGLCFSLGQRYGLKGRAILPYDMVFVDMLLNALYEKELHEEKRFCIVHPTKKQDILINGITDYAADMGLMLAYYKLLDDVHDDKKMVLLNRAGVLRKNVTRIRDRWPRQAEAAASYIEKLGEVERLRTNDLDSVAGLTGTALGEIFVMEEDLWSDILRRMGFFLGKFVYLMDAYEDLEKDRKKKLYNPWEFFDSRKDFEAFAENTLVLMMTDCAKEFEKLPIVQDAEILRNIVYSGVWMRYRAMKEKKHGNRSV